MTGWGVITMGTRTIADGSSNGTLGTITAGDGWFNGLSAGNVQISDVPTPVSSDNAANKGYVDTVTGNMYGSFLIDFGDNTEQVVTQVLTANVSSTSQSLCSNAYKATSGRDLGEVEMDVIDCKAGNVVAGVSFQVVLTAQEGPVHGTYYVNYTLNN